MEWNVSGACMEFQSPPKDIRTVLMTPILLVAASAATDKLTFWLLK
jgi:hypothetical protein